MNWPAQPGLEILLQTAAYNVTSKVRYLAPDEHAAEDNLQTVEEVVADDNDCSTAGRPTFIGTDRLDRRRRRTQETWPYTSGNILLCIHQCKYCSCLRMVL